MAITYLGLEAPARRIASRRARERRYVEVHKLRSTDINVDRSDILNHEDLPATFDALDEDTGCLLESKEAEQQKSPELWLVTCEYSSECPNPDEEGTTPLARTFRPEYIWESYKKVVTRDVYGKILRNRAGDVIVREIDDSRLLVRWQKNAADYDIEQATASKDGLNDASWLGRPKYTWKVRSINGMPRYDSNTAYYEIHYEFHHRPETWLSAVLNQGYVYEDENGFRLRFRDKQGHPEPEPRQLDLQGFPLTDSDTTLASGCTAGQTSIEVATAGAATQLVLAAGSQTAGSPYTDSDYYGPDYGFIEIGDEVLQITGSNSGAILLVARGKRGSTAASHSSSSAVKVAPIELRTFDYNVIDYSDFGL